MRPTTAMKASWWWVWLLFVAGFYVRTTDGSGACPPGCYCIERRSELVPDGSGLKINCHPLSSGSLNFSLVLPQNTIHLDLAKYGLTSLSTNAFASAPFLQKLDLQNNEISKIEDGAFKTLHHLELLDLSRNSLEFVSKHAFLGLRKLERLKLNDNRIQTLEAGSLDNMTSLNKLELADNSFVCNCSLTWFIDWLAARPNVLTNTARTKCALPIGLADVSLRKANKDEFRCGDFAKDNLKPVGLFELEPNEHQVAFEGDPLKLSCRIQISATQKVTWLVKGKPADASDADNVHFTSTLLPGDIVEASVALKHLKASHSGDWTCIVGTHETSSAPQIKPSWSTPLQKSINILVITSETKLCSPHVSYTSRGTFRWGVAVGGHTVQQSCPSARQQQRGFGFAYYLCRQTGEWAPSVNASQCAYTSSTTETLHKFASMNTSFDTVTLLESAKHFLNFTSNPEIFEDPLDIVYFSRAVENYLPYLKRNTDVGHYMMDMISNTLGISSDLMGRAQKRGLASKQLIDIIENITSVIPTFQHHGESLAVEGHPLMQLQGRTCTWYSTSPPIPSEFQRFSPKRVFHCAQGNKTLPSQGKKILSNVVIPHNLYQQLTSHGLLLSSKVTIGGGINLQLTFAAFANASLFPTTLNPPDFESVVGPVAGGLVVGLPVFNLTDPVYVMLWSPENLETVNQESVQPLWWNPSANGGFGDWSPDFCKIINAKSNLVWFSCSRLGYYSFRFTRGSLLSRSGSGSGGFRFHHPVAYVCAAICISVLLLSTMVYITCHASLRISRKLKHALPNVWASMALLCFIYVAGIHQTQHQIICRSIGIFVHYLTLTTLLWLVVCTHIVYQKVTKQRRQSIRRALGQEPIRTKLKRPVTRFYFFGWGVGIIVVAITASINVEYYTTSRHCFLKLAPFLGTVVVPAAVLLSLMLGFALSAYCVLSTAPSHVTEQIEVDVLRHHGRPNDGGVLSGSGSLLSISTFNIPDEERSAKSLLHSQGLLLLLYIVSWATAALAVTNPSTIEQVFPLEDLFAIFFGLSSAGLGLFVFVNFCVLRRDVRRCWRQPICLSRSSRQNRAFEEEDDDADGLLETSNLMNLYPNPTMMGQQQSSSGAGPQFNFANTFPSNTINDNLPPPHAYNFGVGMSMSKQFGQQDGGGEGHQQHGIGPPQRVMRGTVIQVDNRGSKDTNTTRRKDSDEVSSDHLSVNNLNHLRRGYAAPVNSGCVSEADYTMLPNAGAGLFGLVSTKGNSILTDPGKQIMSHQQPLHTSSPAGSSLPQFIDLSPLVPIPESQALNSSHGPYGVISLAAGNDLDSRLENGYTESCTIKVGQPCQMASITTADFPSHVMTLTNRQSQPGPRFGRALYVGGHKSASMPRRQQYSRHKSKKESSATVGASSDHDRDETGSKYSVGSSTCYSSKSNNQQQRHRRHKRPNRKRSRNPKPDEPVYNNVATRRFVEKNDDDNDSVEDNNYHGDNDQFDTLERRTNRSSIPASSEDQIFEPLLASDEDSKDLTSSQLIHDFNAADLLKRETSV